MPFIGSSFTPVENDEGGRTRSRRRLLVVVVAATVVTVVVGVVVAIIVSIRSPVQPGLTAHPSDHIFFRADDPNLPYIQSLNNLETRHEQQLNDFRGVMMECTSHTPKDPTATCLFRMVWLPAKCSKAENWGYNLEEPCVILTLNQVPEWVPDVYTTMEELPEEMPTVLRDTIERTIHESGNSTIIPMLWVSCVPKTTVDQDSIGDIYLSPWAGFPSYYFPALDAPAYIAPMVAMQYSRVERGVLTKVVCRLWAKNIDPNENPLEIELTIE